MQREVVQVSQAIRAAPEAVWRVLREFSADWHPDMVWCRELRDARGSVVREFEGSDGGTCRERLTWLSDSDRTLCYAHVKGISGIEFYRGRITAEAVGDDATLVQWQVEIGAREARLADISNATRGILERGLEHLCRGLPDIAPPDAVRANAQSELRRERIEGTPALSILSGAAEVGGSLVLCLHGIGGNAGNWRPQMEALGARFPMAALDMRGYGGSEPGSDPTRIEDCCADLLQVAGSTGAGKLVLVGLSMGSWIATSFAMRHPDRLAGLVLAGGCTGMSEASAEERARFRTGRDLPLSKGQTPAEFAPGVVDLLAGPDAGPELRETLRASMAAIPAQSYLDALGCFCAPSEHFDFRRIECPVLLMTGADDRLAPPAEIRGVARRMHEQSPAPDIRFEVLADAGHVCNLERPDLFNAHLERFLVRVVVADRKPSRAEKRLAKERRILAAALAEFCASGYDGASMEALARRAGVSKPTLYQYFGNKAGLFAAVLEQGRAHIIAPLARDSGSLVDRLWEFSWTYAAFVLRPDMLSLARLILGEAERHPESAVAYHRSGPGKAFAGIVRFIEGRVAAGQLAVEDAELAAQDLWSLILSGPRDHHLHHVEDRPDPDSLRRSIGHGLKVFLRVYATDTDADLRELQGRIERHRAAVVPADREAGRI